MSELSLTDLHREAARLGEVASAAMIDLSVPRDEVRALIRAWGAALETRAARIDLLAARRGTLDRYLENGTRELEG